MDVLLLAPVNPFDARDGHRMAVASDLCAALDSQLTVGVVTFLYHNQQPPQRMKDPKRCDARFFRVRKGSFPVRFVRGLFGKLPPSAERLYTKESMAGVRQALKSWNPRFVIVDDVSMSGYIPLVREITPDAKVILRTHNVMQDVRREHLDRTKGLLRLPVGCDYRRYVKFEATAMERCDAHWAISQEDAVRMSFLYGRPSDCLSVSIRHERYRRIDIEEGDNHCFVHVGTLDFRRRADLDSFLKVSWPRIRAVSPKATVNFVGQLSGPAIHAPGAVYSGPVANDADAYRKGRFALNFQSTTGGIKLKTLTSLAAGRTLVSTPRGVEGLRLIEGEHYWDMSSFLSPNHLAEVLEDAESSRRMGQAGREWVVGNHSRAAVASQFRNLLGAA